MAILKGACIIAQSGGPTAVINSSVYGVIKTALANESITAVYGSRYGIRGILNDDLVDLGKEDPSELALIRTTPSAVLGSCRYKLKEADADESDYMRITEVFRKHDVRYFFLIGGNDSMDTCNKISKYMKDHDYECRIVGIPKTIDNDLACTDHCPGFGSAAKYISTLIMELSLDARVYDMGMITIVEIMGRNAGWLTASASLACLKGCGPDLIFCPEIAFDLDEFIKKVIKIYNERGKVIITVSEGIRDKNGRYIYEGMPSVTNCNDGFGHIQLGGLAPFLACEIKKHLNTKIRGIELSLLQRCAAHCASATDIEEACRAGIFAVEKAIEGANDKMVGLVRVSEDGKYKCVCELFDLSEVANAEKTIPADWFNNTDDGINEKFIDYILPLIQGETDQPKEDGLPRFAHLKYIKVE